jgi:DNA-binding CsgD family transcriptional regulator
MIDPARSASHATRTEKAAEAARLHAQGAKLREIAAAIGCSISYVYDLVSDPDGAKAKARKRSYEQACIDCGARVSGNEGRKPTPLCFRCAVVRNTVWPRERIIAVLQTWAAEHGRTPACGDFWRAKRNGEDLPSINEVKQIFGSWLAAIDTAGLPRHKRAGPAAGYVQLTPAQRRSCARRYAAGESSVDIAADLGCSPGTVIKWVRRHGGAVRPNFVGARELAA